MPVDTHLFPPDQLLTVSDVARLTREMLESGFPYIWLSGELSNVTYAHSGHVYFVIKDAGAQLRAVIWRSKSRLINVRLTEGQQVMLAGQLTFYEGRGDVQLIVDRVQQAGRGALYEKFLQIKARLLAEGVFDEQSKRPLPAFPKRIVIITSRKTAALQDVLTVLSRRAPQVRKSLLHVAVQGEAAVGEIVAALDHPQLAEADAVLLCRGGGAIEDLWCFNDQRVAYAIRRCPCPVVCGIGHETDTTIADYAADVRAATPSAAAELIAPSRQYLLQQLQQVHYQLNHKFNRLIADKQQAVDRLAQRLISPAQRLAQQRQVLHATAKRLHLARHQLSRQRMQQLESCQRHLNAVNPHAILARGYAIVWHNGSAVRVAGELQAGDTLQLKFWQGEAAAKVIE